jgi:hypothetical protein
MGEGEGNKKDDLHCDEERRYEQADRMVRAEKNSRGMVFFIASHSSTSDCLSTRQGRNRV